MRLVHLSDLHLGFRQFQRQNSTGTNQREADVAATCARAIEAVIRIAPDVVLVGGDIFHQVRPSNSAILDGFRMFSALREALPQALIVMISGNHDVPRVSDAGCILQLFSELNIHVVHRGIERIDDAARDLSVLAVPYAPPGVAAPDDAAESAESAELQRLAANRFSVDPGRKYNVLLLHDEVRGVVPDAAHAGDRSWAPVDPLELERDDWDYIGLGHYHVYRRIDLRHASGRAIPCFYSGSLDYTSTNPWGEVREEVQRNGAAPGSGKGFIEYNLVTGAHVFHAVAPSRRFLDLPAIDASQLTADELDQRIAATINSAGEEIDNAIVRLVVTNVSRHVLRTLDYAPLRAVRRRTLHFHLDTRKPELAASDHAAGAAGRRSTLRDRIEQRLRKRPLPPGLDRDRLVQLGLAYLTRAEDAAVAALPVAEV